MALIVSPKLKARPVEMLTRMWVANAEVERLLATERSATWTQTPDGRVHGTVALDTSAWEATVSAADPLGEIVLTTRYFRE